LNSFTIEPLVGEEDLKGVLEVESESFANPWTREMYDSELRNPDVCHIYVARISGCQVAGFCAFWLVVDQMHVNNLAVRPSYRGRGLGSALISHALMEAFRSGAQFSILEVRRSNAEARKLYERFGFKVVGTRLAYYKNPIEDALVLRRDGKVSKST
jgi:ribosomal-protein-alanine N-acetyltransferase